MRSIKLPRKPNDRDWSMQFVDDSDYDELFDEDVDVYKPDGSPLLFLRKKALTQVNTAEAWGVLKKAKISASNNRGTATGIASEPWRRDDGKIGTMVRVPRGWTVESYIIGYFERTTRYPFCRACAWNLEHPEEFKRLHPMVKEVDALFKATVPDRYAAQKNYADKTSKDFLIPGTVFTTLTVNKTFRTACHKDAGDLEAGFSCLSVIRQGVYTGGNLVLPNWRIAVKLDTYDVVMFDAHEFHGNTQIVPISKDAVRCSVVYYYREQMINCGSTQQELASVRLRKRGDPLWP